MYVINCVISIALVLFALAFIYFWNNGYYFIVTRILRRNEKIGIPIEFTKTQKNIGRGFFILFVAIFISIIYGIAWAIGETFSKQMENFHNDASRTSASDLPRRRPIC